MKVLFVLADTPAFLTFLHILHFHSCVSKQSAAYEGEMREKKKNLKVFFGCVPSLISLSVFPSLLSLSPQRKCLP